MKILMVSWEYPPVVIGGLGRHVHHLSTALAAAGHDVVVLSRRPSGTDPSTHPSSDEVSEGIRVIAAAQDPHEFTFSSDMMAWTLAMGHSMIRAGLPLKKHGTDQSWRPDVVHAHDWLVADPAVTLAQFYDVPVVSTIHATEAGRHSGGISHQPVVCVYHVGTPGLVGAVLLQRQPGADHRVTHRQGPGHHVTAEGELVRILCGRDHSDTLADLVGRRMRAGIGA